MTNKGDNKRQNDKKISQFDKKKSKFIAKKKCVFDGH